MDVANAMVYPWVTLPHTVAVRAVPPDMHKVSPGLHALGFLTLAPCLASADGH